MEVSEPNPFKAWLGDPAWNDILALCELPAFKDFKQSFKANSSKWEDVMNVNTPFESVNALAGDTMDTFKKLCVLRCIRPDAVVGYLTNDFYPLVIACIAFLNID